MIPVRIEGDAEFKIGLIQPILIASALVSTDVPLKVANVLPTNVKVTKGEILATCEPVVKIVNYEEANCLTKLSVNTYNEDLN